MKLLVFQLSGESVFC